MKDARFIDESFIRWSGQKARNTDDDENEEATITTPNSNPKTRTHNLRVEKFAHTKRHRANKTQ